LLFGGLVLSHRGFGLWVTAAGLLLLVPSAAAEKRGAPPERDTLRAPARSSPSLPVGDREAPAPPAAERPSPAISTRSGVPHHGHGYLIESGPVSFGDVLPDADSEIPAAIRVRVFSDRAWALKLVATSQLILLDRHDPVPLSRLAWRSRLSGGFVPLAEDRSVTIARGSLTDGAGDLVVVDLRLRLAPADEIGRYGCVVRLLLDDM
jgi:hypothetical protein